MKENHNRCRIAFLPEEASVRVACGTTILVAAREAGIGILSPCGGNGTCGKCKVVVEGDASEPNPTEREVLTASELAAGVRFACQCATHGDVTVTVPEESRRPEGRILETDAMQLGEIDSPLTKVHVKMPRPELGESRSVLDILIDHLPEGTELMCRQRCVVQDFVKQVVDAEFDVTAGIVGDRLYRLEAGDTTDSLYGVAVDIGTTTVVGTLMDLSTGRSLGVASRTNPQKSYGDDVISRIAFAGESEDHPEQLQKAIVDCLNDILRQLASTSGIDTSAISLIGVAGNPTMNHLLLGIDVRPIGVGPYLAGNRAGLFCNAGELGLEVAAGTAVYVLPNISAFVGGDIVAVALATDLMHAEKLTLALDIGTNGELMLGTRERMLATSCATGPALEGARIAQGMGAADGAIDHVDIAGGELVVSVLGNAEATGICGSGLFDIVAALLDAGIVDETGRMLDPGEHDSLSQELASRLRKDDEGPYFVLVEEPNEVRLTQRDVREFQLAKAAISAGIGILLTEYGAAVEDIDEVLMAGAFGNYIRKSSALRVGILPAVDPDRVKFVGNAASAGARRVLLDRGSLEDAERLSTWVTYVELGTRADFQMAFAEKMMF
jgi:uncharacterized 2Fe-2S/4Fe-4S cluster protein (DUF4445 family)